jgi:molybdate transport system permease protein
MKISRLSLLFVVVFVLFLGGIFATGLFSIGPADIREVLAAPTFFSAVFFSLKTALIATVLSFVFGIPTGFYLARKKSRFSRVLDVLFDIPIIIPPLIVGVLLLTFFNLPVVSRFHSFIFTTSGAVIAQFFVAAPFTIKSARNAFELVPPVYERIAMTLGASPFVSFYDTTFRIAFPGILSGLILTWLRCMGEFGATLMVGGGIRSKTENLPIHVYLHMSSGDFNLGITVSMLTILLAIGCVLVVNIVFLKSRHQA